MTRNVPGMVIPSGVDKARLPKPKLRALKENVDGSAEFSDSIAISDSDAPSKGSASSCLCDVRRDHAIQNALRYTTIDEQLEGRARES
jgi:hypothetical protein